MTNPDPKTPEQQDEEREFHIREAALNAAVEWHKQASGVNATQTLGLAQVFAHYLRTGKNLGRTTARRLIEEGMER